MVSIYFRLQSRTQHRGWRVVGNCEELGSWDPRKGLELNVRQQNYWTSGNPIKVSSVPHLEYKYAYYERDRYQWEALPFNRTLTPAHSVLIVDDEESQPVSKTHISSFSSYPTRRLPYYFPDAHLSDSPSKLTIKLIIASWAMPLSASKHGDVWELQHSAVPWVEHLHEALQCLGYDFQWICAFPGDTLDAEYRSVLAQHNVIPVLLPTEVRLRHEQYVNTVMSPVFRSLTGPLLQYAGILPELWEAYRSANVHFADAITEVYSGVETIWLNDLDLMLTPSFLTRRARDPINLGLMLHHPFPSSEIMKLFPHRSVWLNSLLCCDLLCFETFRYAKHFLSACSRVMEVPCNWREGGAIGVEYCGRFVTVEIGFAGICDRLIKSALRSSEYRSTTEELQKRFSGQSVFVSIDHLQPSSGLLQKVEILRSFLQTQTAPERFQLVQICISTPGHEPYAESFQSAITRINSDFSHPAVTVVLVPVSGMPLAERLAYYSMASAYFDTSLISGVSLNVLEFLAMNSESQKLVIISEFSAFAKVLKSPVTVNPFDTDSAREELLYIDGNRQGFEQDVETAKSLTAERFCARFVRCLHQARKDEKEFVYSTYGLGASLKYVALSKNFTTLFDSDIFTAYQRSRNRLIFVDNEGTLTDIRRYADSRCAQAPPEVIESLEDLCRDERNAVYVATGRGKQVLDEMYSVQGLGLVAEYGSFIKDKFTFYQWEREVPHRLEWLTPAADIIKTYVARVEGSQIELKETTAKFSYSDADRDYAVWQSQELVSHLTLVMQPFQDQCEVVTGSDYVEVRSWGVSKGATINKVAKMLETRKGDIDFILAIGDGVSDEELFRELRRNFWHCAVFSCVVGMKPTSAQYYVADKSEVVRLLQDLRRISLKVKCRQTRGNVSHSDFRVGARMRGRSFANEWESFLGTDSP